MEEAPTRRSLVAASGFLAASAVAGCLGDGTEPSDGNGGDGNEDATEESSGVSI